MSFRMYSKTTFGMSNMKWVAIIGILKIVLSPLVVICAGIESYPLYEEDKKMSQSELKSSLIVIFHYELYLGLQFFMGVFLLCSNITSKEWLRTLMITTSVSCLYNYNPWISYHQQNVHVVYIFLKYTFLLHPILVPFMILTSLFALWLHWKIRRIEQDYEPCEVIYGGEDSATKILIDKYE